MKNMKENIKKIDEDNVSILHIFYLSSPHHSTEELPMCMLLMGTTYGPPVDDTRLIVFVRYQDSAWKV